MYTNTVYRQNRVNNIMQKYVNIFGTSVLKYCYNYGHTLSIVCSPAGNITYSDEWVNSQGIEDVPAGDGWEVVDICVDRRTMSPDRHMMAFYEDRGELPFSDVNGIVLFNLSDYVYTNATIGELCNI